MRRKMVLDIVHAPSPAVLVRHHAPRKGPIKSAMCIRTPALFRFPLLLHLPALHTGAASAKYGKPKLPLAVCLRVLAQPT